MGLSAAELEERRAYLGGTDAAALAGVNPPGWAQPIDVYLEKRGLAPARAASSAMSLGSRLEPVVADLFTEATGLRLRRPARPVRSRAYPWAGGHLDRWAQDGLPFEAKWAMSSHGWGPGFGVGTPEAPIIIPAPGDPAYAPVVPLHYAVQVQHYLLVTERPTAYLAVLLGYGEFRWYALHRDEALIGTLAELEERFWHDNVLAGVPPEPDGSESYGRRIRQLHHNDDGSEAVATPEQQQLLEYLRAARLQAEAAGRAQAEIEQRLQLSMGSTSRLVAPGATVSWKQQADNLRVRWEELATELVGEGRVPPELVPDKLEGVPWEAWSKKARAELVRAEARRRGHAETHAGSRPFIVKFDEETEA